jgi:putative membrane protein
MKLSRIALMALVAGSIFAGSMALAQTPTDTTPTAVSAPVVPNPVHGGLPSHFWTDLVAAFAFGVLVILLVILGYKVIDWALKGVCFDTELTKGNMAVGVVVAAIIIGISLSVSNVVVAILH